MVLLGILVKTNLKKSEKFFCDMIIVEVAISEFSFYFLGGAVYDNTNDS